MNNFKKASKYEEDPNIQIVTTDSTIWPNTSIPIASSLDFRIVALGEIWTEIRNIYKNNKVSAKVRKKLVDIEDKLFNILTYLDQDFKDLTTKEIIDKLPRGSLELSKKDIEEMVANMTGKYIPDNNDSRIKRK